MSFLKAEWRKLAIANYQVDASILKKYLPPKTALDLWNNICYISLVGFMFINTRLLGMPVPYHKNFEEVNLRFYVKHFDGKNWRRGVVFIKEIVPKVALTFIANTVYREHYETMKMNHLWNTYDDHRVVEYTWQKNNKRYHFMIKAELPQRAIESNSETEFITDHFWGYTKLNQHQSYEYEVTHPTWRSYNVLNYSIKVDFNEVYGSDFGFLNQLEPKSVMLAEGSGITVEHKRKI